MADFLAFLLRKMGKDDGRSTRRWPQDAALAPSQIHLLKDVLDENGVPNRPEFPDHGSATRSFLSDRLSVGARLNNSKTSTIKAASELATVTDLETARILASLVAELENQVFCIAIAGQVKAGKSSLINSLVEELDLLPSDINPWTTVITRLHFGTPRQPQSGASFTFFTQGEWQWLSMGGRTRELTDQLFPDFNWYVLSQQIEDMQKRAAQKLGEKFESLLGTVHSYPKISTDLLNRYVGAGNSAAGGHQQGSDGEYSDIVKVADVFFDLGPFMFPAIVIDTPGLNDPFFVRDEITRQNLETADLYVVVLTARQALSATDLGLLKLLRGLKKDQVIIFVNKIDEIADSAEALRGVRGQISYFLQQEFPGIEMPLVFGSASWARTALSRSDNDEGRELLAEGVGLAPRLPDQQEINATAILEKSGLPSLAVAISDMMSQGPVARIIDEASELVAALCRNFIFWKEIEFDATSKLPIGLESTKRTFETITALKRDIEVRFDAFAASLEEVCTRMASQLLSNAQELTQGPINQSLVAFPAHDASRHAAQLDAKLRVKLENLFQTALESARAVTVADQDKLKKDLALLFDQYGFNSKSTLVFAKLPAAPPPPAALSEPGTVALMINLRDPAAQQLPFQVERVVASLKAEFESIVEKLSEETGKALHQRFSGLAQESKTLTLAPIELVLSRLSNLIQEAEALCASGADISGFTDRELETTKDTIVRIRQILAGLRKEPGEQNQPA